MACLGVALIDITLTTSITTHAHGLGLTVVAEGVETFARAQKVSEVGCDIFQGYMVCRPEHHEALERRLGQAP
jgi:EAL domain-containing protein (putative c-di-GMP-specific phosphodiesterase class I)